MEDFRHPYQNALRNLSAAIAEYKKRFAESKRDFEAVNQLTSKKETFHFADDVGSITMSFTLKQLSQLKPEILQKQWEAIANNPKEPVERRHGYQLRVQVIEKIKKHIDSLSKEKVFIQLQEAQKRSSEKTSELGESTDKINQAERHFYQLLYKRYSDPSKPNPCKDFIL